MKHIVIVTFLEAYCGQCAKCLKVQHSDQTALLVLEAISSTAVYLKT